jgi:zinc protease
LDFITQKHLKDFFEIFIKNKPIEAILVGNFGENEKESKNNALNILKIFLEQLPATTQNIRPKYEFEIPKPQNLYLEKADSLQSSLRMGQILFSKKHEDYSALMILNEIFGGYFGSRLMKNIREDKGYTYGIHSQFVTLRDMGYWAVSADVKKEFLQNTFTEIDKEAHILKQDLVSDAELQTVKQYMLGAFAGSLNTPFDVAETFKAIYFLDLNYDFYDKYLDTIRNITPSQIRDIAQKYLHTDNWVRVSVG